MLEKKKRNILIVIGILIACFLVIGVSYAVWSLTLTQTDKNIVTTGCFKIEFTDQNPITLDKAYPISDEEGKSLTPYEFTLTNTCDSEATYYINLETITSAEKKLNEKYLKAILKKGAQEVFLSNLNSGYINMDKVLPESSNAYKIYQGVLKAKEEATFTLNLWLDENTKAIEEVMNATYEGKITVSTSYKAPPSTKNMMIAMNTHLSYRSGDVVIMNDTYTQNQKYNNISEISFESVIRPYESAVEVVDFSVAEDRSVLGYYIKNDSNNSYALHIQADGKIKVNPNASYYGVTETADSCLGGIDVLIKGLENLDTTYVTDMNYMFCNSSLENPNLSEFDTANVTNMSWMFAGVRNITDIDLSSFNTSNVTSMEGMFYDMQNLTTLDVSHFDTRNVINMSDMFSRMNNLTDLNVNNFNTTKVTDMGRMFLKTSNLTSLDLSSFNTSKVTDMVYMFSEMKGLTALNLSNFDTSEVIVMNSMFKETNNLANLDISSFDTSKVTDMNFMFDGTSSLNSISYGEMFIHNENAMITNMYRNCPANKPTHASWNNVF